MYFARFSYHFLPVNRERAIGFIRRELEAARAKGLAARLLVPLTRPQGGAALQFEVALADLDQLEQFREQGVGGERQTGDWMHEFSEILLCPPVVEVLRVEGGQ